MVKMNAIDRLDILLSDILKSEPSASTNGINQGTSIQPISKLTFPERNSYPSSILPSGIVTTVPLPPRRNSSSLKHHHHRQPHHIDQIDKQEHQPLLNSSTLDDLFRALTLECEQYIADSSSNQNKISNPMIVQPSTKIQASVESNDDDYENVFKTIIKESRTNTSSPLKTSIEVISPIKRHVVSITITSKVSSPPLICPIKTSCNATKLSSPKVAPITPVIPVASVVPITPTVPITVPTTTSVPVTTHCQSSDDDAINISSSCTTRKRRRRARKQVLSATAARSSSSSNERKEIVIDKKPIISKRSCSTDPRYQSNRNSYDNDLISSSTTQKHRTKRPHRRDISLQHNLPNSDRYGKNHSAPLSVLLTSTKPTSDFIENGHQQQRRSRLESVNHKSSTLIDRLHQQFYRPTSHRNNNNTKNNNIPTHRIPPYPVY